MALRQPLALQIKICNPRVSSEGLEENGDAENSQVCLLRERTTEHPDPDPDLDLDLTQEGGKVRCMVGNTSLGRLDSRLGGPRVKVQ